MTGACAQPIMTLNARAWLALAVLPLRWAAALTHRQYDVAEQQFEEIPGLRTLRFLPRTGR